MNSKPKINFNFVLFFYLFYWQGTITNVCAEPSQLVHK